MGDVRQADPRALSAKGSPLGPAESWEYPRTTRTTFPRV
jgi:hypothetical protein